MAVTDLKYLFSRKGLETEQGEKSRDLKVQQLQNSGLPPAEIVRGIADLFGENDKHLAGQHIRNFLGKLTGRKPAPEPISPFPARTATSKAPDLQLGNATLPGATSTVQGPAPRNAQQDLQNIFAQAKTPSQQAAQATTEGVTAEQAAMRQKIAGFAALYRAAGVPEDQIPTLVQETAKVLLSGKAQRPNWKPFKLPSGETQYFDVDNPSSIPPGATAVGAGLTQKTQKPQLKNIRGHDVLWDPEKQTIIKDLGVHGTARRTVHEVAMPDADGVVHMVKETSVSTPEGESIPVDVEGEEEQPAGKGPAPRAGGAGMGDRVLPFQKSTPAIAKAQNDYREAVKLDETAKQIEADPSPSKAVKQHRFAIVLEKMAAGRFTEQALQYALSAGAANSFEQMIKKLTNGEMADDVFRQLLESAHENLRASKTALDSLKVNPGAGPAPKAGTGDDDLLNRLKQATGQ